ncbi:MAG: flagellar basal body P-ring protein FlgI [Deltaproteobacteria bacterium]|nr:flagellar basal body P-ring protein FlgI [Deltaproteobacteria bacterium]
MASLLALLIATSPCAEAARIKDIASVYGIRENALTGFGLVVGLNRTGDSAQNSAAIRALSNRLQGLGMTLSDDDIKSRNVAVVMVTAKLPPGARPGQRIDVTVASTGDARSLEGGVLLLTTLVAANLEDYGTAQGPVTVGGYSVMSGGNQTVKNHPTVGIVTRGGMVEREVPNQLNLSEQGSFEFVLNEPDLTNAARLATVVNARFGDDTAIAVDQGLVRMLVPDSYLGRQAEFLATAEALDVALDHVARVVVNERTGTVVMGADILLSPVAVAHGSLSIEVSHRVDASQPNMLAAGQTALIENTNVAVREESGEVTLLRGATVGDVVGALNAMGVTPRDLIVILQSMRAAGGLHAEIEVM